ncbi:O-methyltransferase [Rhabdothermincola sp.]|uniref:O-methyltransferase n=1 Tax=Rhabdothermincola sp. TaxID=2820405 RepID=UPI002FE060E0
MDTPKSFHLPADIHAYLVDHGTAPDPVQQALIDDTRALGDISIMQIAPEQGALLTLLVALTDARFAVEVGTFTGYSALCIARGLQPGGRLVCCDVNEEWTAVARRAWEQAGVADRIDLRLAPAIETLRALPPEAVVDFAFIDADKPSYIDYYEELLPRLRMGGLLVADNVLWFGRVVDPAATDPDTRAIRRFNDHVRDDPRTAAVMLPVGDGLTIARRVA